MADPNFFATPTGIAVIAATSSFVAGLLGAFISSVTIQSTQRQRIEADRDLVERKFAYDKELAERKFNFDVDQRRHQRKMEIAEAVLAQFYSVRDIYSDARAPFVQAGEMVPKDGEPELVRESNYAPIARLNRSRAELSAFWAKEYEFAALFGNAAREPFHTVRRVNHTIRTAAQTLLELNNDVNDQATRDFRSKCRREAFRNSNGNDELSVAIDSAVAQIEEICERALRRVAER